MGPATRVQTRHRDRRNAILVTSLSHTQNNKFSNYTFFTSGGASIVGTRKNDDEEASETNT